MGCETVHWGFFGSDRRQICDGAKQADGTWQRTRTVYTPSYVKPLSCNLNSWGYVGELHGRLPGSADHPGSGVLCGGS